MEKQLKEEAKYFNKLAKNRSKEGMIPITADVRNATFYKPITDYDELVDVGINNIINEPYQSKAIEAICDSPQGKILDVCCGPGWFSLECARKGRDVIGYDISDEAIAIAKSTYEQNKSTDGIGNIDYVNDNAEKQNLDELNISAVVGWSAFHHLADPREFLLKVHKSLPKDGIVVTFDDLDSGPIEKFFRYLFKFILPIYEHTYFQKLGFIFKILTRKRKPNQMLHSPMEIESDKHGDAAEAIRDVLINDFKPIYDKEFGAFSIFVCMSIKGPKIFRYTMSRIIVMIDNFLVFFKICKGSYRIIISKKL